MRFVDHVVFVKKSKPHYDADLGKEVSDGETKTELLANVTNPTKENKGQLFGDKKTDKIVVHMKQPYFGKYDYLFFNGKNHYFVTESVVGRRQVIYMNGEAK